MAYKPKPPMKKPEAGKKAKAKQPPSKGYPIAMGGKGKSKRPLLEEM